jgi:hypothetical protein
MKINETRMVRILEVLLLRCCSYSEAPTSTAGARARSTPPSSRRFGLIIEQYFTQLRYDLRKLKAHGLS